MVGSTLSRVQKKLTPVENDARKARRRLRFDARRFLGFQSTLRRVRYCGRDSVKGVDGMAGVTVMASGTGTGRRAGFGQVQHCGSCWSCPVCSHKINAVRAAEIADAVIAWHAAGNRIVFLTLTMRHNATQSLDDLWTHGVSAAWGRVTSGRPWKTDQETYGVRVDRLVKTGKRAGETVTEDRIGFARVVETTHGANGWHVHVHALLFVRGDISGKEAFALGDSMFARWRDSLVAAGFGAPTPVHGVDVRLVGPADAHAVAKYFEKNSYGQDKAGKLGWEAAGGTGKSGSKRFGNRTPFEILRDASAVGPADANGELNNDMAIWWEWETASKGKRQLTWSPWLRAMLFPEVEKTDEEIANEKLEGGEIVLRLRDAQWKAIEPRADELLDAVEADDDMGAAYAWLAEHCVAVNAAGGFDKLYSPGEFAKPLVLLAA